MPTGVRFDRRALTKEQRDLSNWPSVDYLTLNAEEATRCEN
jgi:hypothetical protein